MVHPPVLSSLLHLTTHHTEIWKPRRCSLLFFTSRPTILRFGNPRGTLKGPTSDPSIDGAWRTPPVFSSLHYSIILLTLQCMLTCATKSIPSQCHNTSKAGRFASSSTSALMISFESFWDSECSRFGEEGAPGFASWLETRKHGGSFPKHRYVCTRLCVGVCA